MPNQKLHEVRRPSVVNRAAGKKCKINIILNSKKHNYKVNRAVGQPIMERG